jgi:hypothetical protein
MTINFLRSLLTLVATLGLALVPVEAKANNCSNAAAAGDWAYTYTGTVFTPGGPVPAASLGHFSQDSSGNIVGSQTRSVAGISGVEEILGKLNVNKD